jgi:hypothetical protein
MINRQQIEKMIDCYGADLARWPCEDKNAIADFIENDSALSESLFMARQIDQSATESIVSAEVEWLPVAENRLLDIIIQQSAQPSVGQKESESTWRRRFEALLECVQSSMTKPLLPVGIATVVLLLFVVQLNLEERPPIKDLAASYSTAELEDWLVFEGLASDESLAELDLDEPLIFENEAEESGFEPEVIFFL